MWYRQETRHITEEKLEFLFVDYWIDETAGWTNGEKREEMRTRNIVPRNKT